MRLVVSNGVAYQSFRTNVLIICIFTNKILNTNYEYIAL